jgi:hypothetical protein
MAKNQCVVGVFDTVLQAEAAVRDLQQAGFTMDQISLVTRHIDEQSDVGKELNYGDDSLRDAAIGATLGGLMGVVSDAAIIMMAGVGTIIATGPILVAGVVAGAFLGALAGWGVHSANIRKYESLVQEGKVLVVVDGDPEQVADADRLLRRTEASEVHLHSKSSDDAPEIDD